MLVLREAGRHFIQWQWRNRIEVGNWLCQWERFLAFTSRKFSAVRLSLKTAAVLNETAKLLVFIAVRSITNTVSHLHASLAQPQGGLTAEITWVSSARNDKMRKREERETRKAPINCSGSGGTCDQRSSMACLQVRNLELPQGEVAGS